MDDETRNNVDHALSVQLLTDIISEAEYNAQSGDPRLALQGRQTVALARIVLNLLGTVEPDTFDNTPAPVPPPVDEAPANPTEQTGDGTVVKTPDQLVGQAPAGENNAALGPDTTNSPANAGLETVAEPSAVDTLSGAPVPDKETNGAGDSEPVREEEPFELTDTVNENGNTTVNDTDSNASPDTNTSGDTVPSGDSQADSSSQTENATNDANNNGGLNNGNFVSG